MTIVHNLTVKEYAYFNAVKRPSASFKYLIPASATQAAESTKSTPSPQAVETIKTG
jgi:hypothetical protein